MEINFSVGSSQTKKKWSVILSILYFFVGSLYPIEKLTFFLSVEVIPTRKSVFPVVLHGKLVVD
jgi:hypothetical protein